VLVNCFANDAIMLEGTPKFWRRGVRSGLWGFKAVNGALRLAPRVRQEE